MPLLHTLDPLTFLDCQNLTFLSLASNRKLSDLPPGVFSTTPHLQYLDISNVPWTHLTADQLPVNPKKVIVSGKKK